MQNLEMETTQQKPVRRFLTYEEFLKTFYPASAESAIADEEAQKNGDFGTNLAIDSLNRHAEILKFGDV